MPTLHLMVGLPCSGKTTRARELEATHQALRLTPDEWHLALYGQDLDHPEHDLRHHQIEALMWQVAARALAIGVDVILDFGLWARSERDEFRQRAAALGAQSQIHYLAVAEAELLRRLTVRNRAQRDQTFVIPLERMHTWIQYFQPPAADELV